MTIRILKTLCLLILNCMIVVPTTTIMAQTRPIEALLLVATYSPDGSLIAIGGAFESFYGVKITNSLGEPVAQLTTEGLVTSVSWSPDGNRFAVRLEPFDEYGETIYIYNFAEGKFFDTPSVILKTAYPSEVSVMPWSPDGKFLLNHYGVFLTVWDVQSGGIVFDLVLGTTGRDAIEDLAWHPVTNEIYVLNDVNMLSVYDAKSGLQTREPMVLPFSEPLSVDGYPYASEFAFNSDGSELAIVFNDDYQTTRIIDPVSGKTLREFRPENPHSDIRSLRWVAEDKLLVTVGVGVEVGEVAAPFAVRFWDAETGELLHSYENLLGGYVRDFAVNPDATRMVVIGGFPESAGRPGSLPLTDDVGLTLETNSALLLYLEPIVITP